MAKRFFRVQHKGWTFEQMQAHNSESGGDIGGEGLAVSMSPGGLDGGSRFGGAWNAMDDDDELVILEGRIVAEIYDGYRIIPTKEVARFTIAEWGRMLNDGSAWDWEAW